MSINKVSSTTKQLIRDQSVLALPDRPSEKGYSAKQLKEYFTNLVLGDVSSLTELDRVVEEINKYVEGIEDTTIKNFVIDTVINKFTQQAPFISLKFEDNKLKYTKFGNPSIDGELDIIPENSVFFHNEQLKSKTNENIYPKTTLENIIGEIENQNFKEYLLELKTKIEKIESNHEIDIKLIEDSLSQIIGGDAPAALDSIKELAEALKNNPSSLDDILLQISDLRTSKVDVVAGKQLSTNDFDNSSKSFLEELKNKDVALKTDIKTNLSELKEDSQHRLVSDDEKSNWNSKANEVHTHSISDVNGLQGKLDLKSDVGHTHSIDDLGAEASGTAMRLVGEHNQNYESHKDIREAIQDVSKKVDGINNALTFYNTQELQNWFNGTYTRPDGIKPSDLYVGQYLYIKDKDEDDYWVSEVPATFSNISVLQTDKIDLSGYAELDNLSRVAFSGNYNDLNNKPTIPNKLSELIGDTENRTISDTKLQQIDKNTSNISSKLDKNLGSSEGNKMVITDSSGNVTTAPAGSMSVLVDNLESDSTTMAPTANQVRILNNIKLNKQQGVENSGKHLIVNDSGLIDLIEPEQFLPDTSDFVTKSGTETITGGKTFSAGISTDLIQSSNSKNIIGNISNNTYVGDTTSYLWLQSSYRPVVNENGSYYELAYYTDISSFVEKDSMYYYYKTKYDESLNLFNEDTHYHSGQAYGDGGNIVWWNGYTRFDDYIKVKPYTAYTLSINAETNIYITMCYYNGDLEFISDNNSHFGTFATPENCEYIRFACGKLPSEIYYIMLNEGAVRLPYTKYNSNKHISNGQATLLKDEYEKTLNLFTYAGESITIHSGNEQWKEYRFSDFGLVEGETYTISSYDVPNGISLQLLDGYNNFANSKITFVYNSSNNRFRVGGNSVSQNTTFDLNVQIIKGTYTGGYHDFHGSILHYRDLGTLLWENGSQNSDFGEQQVTTLDRSGFRYIVVVYKNYKSDERAWQCQFFKNSKYYQNGSLFFVEVGYTKVRSFSFESSSTSVLFGNGYENGNQSNSQMIPVAIYGIK